jgi:RAB protein geranylgeranyltransferase component A
MIKKYLLNLSFLVFILMFSSLSFSQNARLPQQQQNQNQNQQQMKQPVPNVDDATLDKFIKAAKEIEGIKMKYMQEFQTKAEKDMDSVLKKYGFDKQTYNQIGNAIGQNPELMKKARQKLGK